MALGLISLCFLCGGFLCGFFLLGWVGVSVAYHMQAHEVGGAGFGAGSGYDAYNLPLLDVAVGLEEVSPAKRCPHD